MKQNQPLPADKRSKNTVRVRVRSPVINKAKEINDRKAETNKNRKEFTEGKLQTPYIKNIQLKGVREEDISQTNSKPMVPIVKTERSKSVVPPSHYRKISQVSKHESLAYQPQNDVTFPRLVHQEETKQKDPYASKINSTAYHKNHFKIPVENSKDRNFFVKKERNLGSVEDYTVWNGPNISDFEREVFKNYVAIPNVRCSLLLRF